MNKTEPGTVDDLMADARSAGFQATPRLVTDWVSHGLLDRPDLQPKGRGRGSDKGLYPASQRNLFLTLLDKRRTATHVRALARIPLSIWLYAGDDFVPTRQALRVFTTWIGDSRASLAQARWASRQVVGQLNNADAAEQDRRALLTTLTDIAYTGRADHDELDSRIRAVFEPYGSTVPKAVGHPAAPLMTSSIIDIVDARMLAARSLAQGEATENDLQDARQQHLISLAEYVAQLPTLAAHAPPHLATMFGPITDQTLVDNCGNDLLTVLGLQLRRSRTRPPGR